MQFLRSTLLVAALCVACGGTTPPDADAEFDADASIDAAPIVPFDCASLGCGPDEAPLPEGDGGVACVRVGAELTTAPGPWPDLAGTEAPRVFVSPDAMPGGDGTMGAPLRDLFAAVAARSDARTFVLARGTHALTGPLVFASRTVTLIGAGAGDTGAIIAPAPGAAGISIDGMPTDVTLTRLSVRYASPPGAGAAVEVTAGARVALRDVLIDGAHQGVRAVDATVDATRLTVLRAGLRGVALFTAPTGAGAGSVGRLESLLVRDGAGGGLVVDRSALDLRTALIAHNALDGLVLYGGESTPRPAMASRVASLCNGVTGVRVERGGVSLEAALFTVAGTRAPAMGAGGDGVYVGPGGTLALDYDGLPHTDELQGRSSSIVGNARTGVLVSAALADGGTAPSAFRVYGALVNDNAGPGVFVQQRGTAEVGYSRLERNVALGVGVSSEGDLRALICDGVRDTRPGVLQTQTGPLPLGGDGLSIAGNASAGRIEGNRFDRNARFAVLFASATVDRFAFNNGRDNGIGYGEYATAIALDLNNMLMGGPPPAAPPRDIARGPVSAPQE